MTSFYDLVLVLVAVLAVGLLAERLRVPLLTVYLAAGIVLGPAGLGYLAPHEVFTSLGSLGVSLFLFSIALTLDLRTFRFLGVRALAAGLGQIVVTAVAAWWLGVVVGLRAPTLWLIVCVLVISSTVVVLKVLASKKELESLHGQLAVAISILQDLAVVLALVWLTASWGRGAAGDNWPKASKLVLGLLVLVGGYTVGTQVVLRLLQHTLRNVELQLVAVLALAAGYAAVSSALGFSRELGAFIAGLSVAASPYKDSVSSRLLPLRDFLLLFFFLDLGTRVSLTGLRETAFLALVLSSFALVVKPAILLALLVALRYSLRTSFLTAVAMGQVSEFSFLLAGVAAEVGVADEHLLSLVATVGVCTFLISPLLIEKSEVLYAAVAPRLERALGKSDEFEYQAAPRAAESYSVVCFGLGRYGLALVRRLADRGHRVLGVDFDPLALRRAKAAGVDVVYGDADDEELYERLPLREAKWVVCTVRSSDVAEAVLRGLRRSGWTGHVALAAENDEQEAQYERAGAHVILRPYEDGAELAAEAITDAADLRLSLANWAVCFREIRLSADSIQVGRTIAEISLRSQTGATIVAVSRGGRAIFDPPPETQLFPNDRLLVMGRKEELERAEDFFDQRHQPAEDDNHFEIARFVVEPQAEVADRTLAQSSFRRRYGLTVVGLERGAQKIVLPSPEQNVCAGDVLVVIGLAETVSRLASIPGFRRIE
ncbi:MAG: cation:proton antiporter [Candidatus Sumerlaeaceae bacterium]